MRVRELFHFIHERHQVYLRKERGEPKPWTRDPILQQYRFTTAYRELDKVTVWIREHWRDPHKNDPMVWFAICVARYFNWPPTLDEIGYPVPWNEKKILLLLLHKNHEVADRPQGRKRYTPRIFGTAYYADASPRKKKQIFGGAYFINSLGPKIESVVHDRLSALWLNRKQITKDLDATASLADVYTVFKSQFGFGSFMAAQIVADLKYTPRFSAKRMPDWWTWAASGPGSKRGLNRIVGRAVQAPWKEKEWHQTLLTLRERLLPLLAAADMHPMHAQDVQGIACCEWDKYQRTKLGEGRPKTRYPGGAGANASKKTL